MDFTHSLNDMQLEAVTTDSQYCRIIAGAGSGKTRVLTYRIAYLIEEKHVKPWSILAITFTNKVAKEMRDRISKLVEFGSESITIRTFHSFAAYFLRQEISAINYPSTFTILDEEDQMKLIKDIGEEMGFKRSDKELKTVPSFISKWKLESKYPDDIKISYNTLPTIKFAHEVYTRYEEEKAKMFALDFDDLLLQANRILENNPYIRQKWANKIDHILVDEFQDTNDVEYKFLNLLLKPSTELYVVGDPDQTIYTWRGANQKIILDLNTRFPMIKTISLEQNYRSTQNILDCANNLISHNILRIPKNLFTKSSKGDAVTVKSTYSSKDEAKYVATEIKKLHDVDGYRYSDIALLYRSAYVTVDFESALTSLRIPYRIYGGLKFYQRREVKDVLAYFRIISNYRDDISFQRIMNVPKRGIGETSTNNLKNLANSLGASLYETVLNTSEGSMGLSKKVTNALKSLVKRIEIAKEEILKDEETISKILDNLIDEVGYYKALSEEEDGEDRLENVKALFADLRSYLSDHPDASLDEYLQNISLVSGQDEYVEGDFVSLMTVHTAKGLEFPIVFVIRFNENVFPHIRSVMENGKGAMEEERRLAYVAFTRAMKKLYVTYAGGYNFVVQGELQPSQFIAQSGLQIQSNSYYSGLSSRGFDSSNGYNKYPSSHPSFPSRSSFYDDDKPKEKHSLFYEEEEEEKPTSITWKVGDKVVHKTLGKGVVISLEGDDIIKVDFEDHGIKMILGNHKFVSKGE